MKHKKQVGRNGAENSVADKLLTYKRDEDLENGVMVIELLCFLYFHAEDDRTANAAHKALAKLKLVNKRCSERNLLTASVNRRVFYLLEITCLHRVFRKWKRDPRVREFANAVRASGKKACQAFDTEAFRDLELKLSASNDLFDIDECMQCAKVAALSIPPTFPLAQQLAQVPQ